MVVLGMARYNSRKAYKAPAPVEHQPRVVRDWSSFQRAIFAEIQSGSGNVQVDALAGTGKTSTIVEGFYYLPPGKTALMVAFNKSIQTELASRATQGVTVLTLHSLGLRAIKRMLPKVVVDNWKLDGYIKAEKGEERETLELRDNLKKAVSLCKGYLAETSEEISEIMDKHDIDPCDEPRDKFILTVVKIMVACKNDTARIDFDDMIWFPIVHKINLDKYDFVFVDESQDLCKSQIELALGSCKPGGRVISVGDEHQAIYGFRGADSNAIQNIVDRMESKRLPLSVTYRCAKAIVTEAQALVPGIQAGPNAKDGTVETVTPNKMLETVKAGDFILSRINAPLIGYCFELLRTGVKANIQGRDIGKGLSVLIKKSKCSDVTEFLSWLQTWREFECMRLSALNKPVDLINDKADCLETLCEGCRTTVEVNAAIDKLFTDGDDKDRVILSSTHKAKGLERDRVFILRDTYRPAKGQEEANLLYVAITRAREFLFYVNGSR